MRSFSVRLSTLLAVGLLFTQGVARADYMNWSYHWSIGPAPVLASGTGSVSQALGWGGMGSSHILAAAVTTSSDASASDPDRFDKSFSLTLHLTDDATHQSGTLTFHGLISGTLTATSAHLTETFATPTEHLKLGNHIYNVELPSKLTLLQPGAAVVPDYYATVWVTNVAPPPPVHPLVMAAALMVSTASIASAPVASVPEPSSLTLVGLGIALLGACLPGSVRWRNSRKLDRSSVSAVGMGGSCSEQ